MFSDETEMIKKGNYILPDIFLAGTPKSGTTFLFDLIAQHKDICGSNPKEIYFFMDEDNPYINENNNYHIATSNYEVFYPQSRDGLKLLDGTSQSIYQYSLINLLSALQTKPKAIFILREPAERILSSFQYTSQNLASVSGLSFNQYSEILLSGDIGRIEFYCKDYQAFYSLKSELEYSKYINFLKKWKDAVGIENMFILTFEDLIEDARNVIDEIFNFLQLEPVDFSYDSQRKNKSIHVRNRFIHYYVKKFSRKHEFPFSEYLKKIYKKLQFQDSIHESYDLTDLKTYFSGYNDELATTFNIDLSKWHSS